MSLHVCHVKPGTSTSAHFPADTDPPLPCPSSSAPGPVLVGTPSGSQPVSCPPPPALLPIPHITQRLFWVRYRPSALAVTSHPECNPRPSSWPRRTDRQACPAAPCLSPWAPHSPAPPPSVLEHSSASSQSFIPGPLFEALLSGCLRLPLPFHPGSGQTHLLRQVSRLRAPALRHGRPLRQSCRPLKPAHGGLGSSWEIARLFEVRT